jgi:GWxTD domain-containing protein
VKRIRRLLYQPERPRDFTPVLSAALLTVIMAGAMAAWQEPQAPVNLPANSPYNKWLKEDVAYIITDAERTAFKNLPTNDEREKFIEQFWTRRDPTPGTVENEFKEEYYRRIAYTNQHFAATALPGWKTDRGRIYITYGPPDEKESHPSGGAYRRPASEGGGATTTVPFEQWMYRWIEGVGNNVVIEFVDPKGTGEFHMTMDPSEKDAILMTLPPSEQGALPGMARTGATVQVMGNTAALVTVPLKPYSGHGAKVVGRLLSRDGKEVSAFEDNLPGSAPVYTKFVAVQPGTYRLVVLVTDAATGAWARDTLSFEVK